MILKDYEIYSEESLKKIADDDFGEKYVKILYITVYVPDLSNALRTTHLWVSRNFLRTFPPINSITDLKGLYLHTNQLIQLPEVKNLTRLEDLSISKNRFRQLPENLKTISFLFATSLYYPKWLNYPQLVD